MIVYIYSLLSQKKVASPFITNFTDFTNNQKKFYPLWDEKDHISTSENYGDYVVVDSDGVREMTREEKILNGYTEFLFEGEYVENGTIKSIPRPTDLYIPKWNKELNLWQEGATTQDVDRELERLLDEYIELVDKKDKYEKFEFPTDSIYMKMGENTSRRIELIEIRESLGG